MPGLFRNLGLSVHILNGISPSTRNGHVLVAFVYLVVFPQGIDEERVQDVLLFHLDRIDGIHQVGVVHHDHGRFFRKFLSVGVDHIDKTRVGQVT